MTEGKRKEDRAGGRICWSKRQGLRKPNLERGFWGPAGRPRLEEPLTLSPWVSLLPFLGAEASAAKGLGAIGTAGSTKPSLQPETPPPLPHPKPRLCISHSATTWQGDTQARSRNRLGELLPETESRSCTLLPDPVPLLRDTPASWFKFS